jgi:hypothetical protein
MAYRIAARSLQIRSRTLECLRDILLSVLFTLKKALDFSIAIYRAAGNRGSTSGGLLCQKLCFAATAGRSFTQSFRGAVAWIAAAARVRSASITTVLGPRAC